MARNQGEWTEALKHLKTQLRYARSLKDWRVRLQTRLAIGDIHTRLGDTAKGIQLFEEVLQESVNREYVPTQIESHYQLCATHWLKEMLKLH